METHRERQERRGDAERERPLKEFSRMRSIGFSFDLGGLGVKPCSPDVVQPSATVRNRPQRFATVRNRPQPFGEVSA